MGEFEKNQDETNQTDQQTDKPAFDQFDKEKGQQQQGEVNKDELTEEKTDKTI